MATMKTVAAAATGTGSTCTFTQTQTQTRVRSGNRNRNRNCSCTYNGSRSIVLLALLLCGLIPLSSCRRLSSSSMNNHQHGQKVFNIPAFQVNLTLDVSSSDSSSGSDSGSPLLDVSTTSKLKSATVSYLFDYIESILEEEGYHNDNDNNGGKLDRDTFISPLENINLEVSVHVKSRSRNGTGDSNGGEDSNNYVHNHNDNDAPETTLLVAEMAGDVSFTSTKISQNYIITQEKVTIISVTAFLGSMAMNDYESRIQSILPNVLSVRVQSHSVFSSFDDNGDDDRLNHPNSVTSNGNNNDNGGGVGAVGIFLLFFTFISAAILLSAWLYKEHQVKRYGRRSRNGHLLMDTEQYSDSDYYDQDNDGGTPYFTGLESDGSCDSSSYDNSVGDRDPIQFIPVPARFDEVTNGRKSAMAKPNRNQHSSDITPRRYVSTASPFDLLYGAAFSHSEKAKVQSAHGMKKQKTSSSSSSSHRSKAPKATRQLKPLNTITEVNEEEHAAGLGVGVGVGTGESFFPQIMSTISSFIASGTSSNKDQPKEDFVVFRDFPRHDGTPCIMFDGVGGDGTSNIQENNKTPPKAAFQRNLSEDGGDGDNGDDDEDISHASSDSSVYVDENKENIDCFVDKLENLIAARSRQYEERKKMDIELVERKKLRAEQRQREKEIQMLHSDSTSTTKSKNSSIGSNDCEKIDVGQEPVPTLFSDVGNIISSNGRNVNKDVSINLKEKKIQSSDSNTNINVSKLETKKFDAEGPDDMPPVNEKEIRHEVNEEIQEKLLDIEENRKTPIVQSQCGDNNIVPTDETNTTSLTSPRDVESLHFEENVKTIEKLGTSNKEETQSIDVIIHKHNELTGLV